MHPHAPIIFCPCCRKLDFFRLSDGHLICEACAEFAEASGVGVDGVSELLAMIPNFNVAVLN